jgi:amidohydrolase
LKTDIQHKAAEYFEEIRNIRRHLHQYPELSFKEHQTSDYIVQRLNDWGIPYRAGWVQTGITAWIKGRNPGKRVVALRADMDALPVSEKNDDPWKSSRDGVMHACGHDVHMACLLGAARILQDLKASFEGTVLLVFQPGEELLPGGARLMMEEGALNDPEPDMVLGLHVQPDIPFGSVGFRPGIYMASNDEVFITVKGRGGHAALPHQVTDTVLIAAHIVVALQQIVSRNADISIPTVLSFGKMLAPGATNVIPDVVEMEGTFRTMDEKWRMEAHRKMRNIACATAESMGAACDIDIRIGYPVLINDPGITRISQELARDYLGSQNVVDLGLRMTSEDFAFYSQRYPSCFFRLGVGKPGLDSVSALHTATFNVHEKAMETGMGMMAWLAFSHLSKAF